MEENAARILTPVVISTFEKPENLEPPENPVIGTSGELSIQWPVSSGQETRNRNHRPNIELYSLEEKTKASWFPFWGERWYEVPKGVC